MVIQETPTQGPAERVLILVREFCGELHADRRARAEVTLDSALDRDLGLDSLSRVELIARIERSFGRHLPEEALTEAETPRDLLRLLAGARVAAAHVPVPIETEPADAPARPAPDYTANLLEALDWHAGEHPDRTHVVLLQDGEHGPAHETGGSDDGDDAGHATRTTHGGGPGASRAQVGCKSSAGVARRCW